MQRRHFLRSAAAASVAISTIDPLVSSIAQAAPSGRKPRILLRNGWQSINIGDIAHWVGLLELLDKHQIDVDVVFWASTLEDGADALLAKHWPKVQVIKGKSQVDAAFKECDFYLSGSGSGFPASGDCARWHKETGKPYGVMGVTLVTTTPEIIETLNHADFAYFRDGESVQLAKQNGLTNPNSGFGPDTAFGVVKTRNDEAAESFLQQNGLEPGKFLVCIPRYRITPHWTIHKSRPFDEQKHQRNEAMKDHDHKPHREAISRIVRETGMKVLVTCEDKTQIALGKEMIIDRLPSDVSKNVVWRDRYWLTDEALSTYVRSAGLFGNEMHSPIMAIANGVPAVVCRFDDQTKKGFMWRDIGLDDWLFDLDQEEQYARIVPTIVEIAKNPAAAKAKAEQARQVVLAKQAMQMDSLKASLAKVT
ncbi:MAG: polysaccharide pyruvyl transferase family protein [Planctomycetaceae bacterium]